MKISDIMFCRPHLLNVLKGLDKLPHSFLLQIRMPDHLPMCGGPALVAIPLTKTEKRVLLSVLKRICNDSMVKQRTGGRGRARKISMEALYRLAGGKK